LSNQSIDFGFFYGILLQAGIVENRLWNGLVEPIDLLWIFLGRCSTLELSKIDFGIVLWNQSIRSTLEFIYGRCSTLELSKIDFGIVEYANGQDCQEKSQ
jgi:hypothetical protein